MLDKRLKLCADMVKGTGIVCDVGTDHGYLAADLILSGKCSRVIASDIKSGPLESAARTVEKYGLSDKIELIISDGLQNVSLDGVSDIVIAGMGGETIVEILKNCSEICRSNINLILQPMSKAEVLIKWLGENGFELYKEEAVEESGKIYVVVAANWSGKMHYFSESDAVAGLLDKNDETSMRYLENQAKRLEKKASALEEAGRHCDSVHFKALSKQLLTGKSYILRDEIYDYLNSVFPFRSQEKWDNSGMLVEGFGSVSRILLTLDIDVAAVNEAIYCGAEMIVSHHPVIFEPLRKIRRDSPVWMLARADITAVCMHTNVDIASNGTNGVILRKIRERFDFKNEPAVFEDCGNGLGLGWICELDKPVNTYEFGHALTEIFKSDNIKMSAKSGNQYVQKFAFVSGSGGSMLDAAVLQGCDAYITGDVKHDVWIEANNRHITLFDCGHFYTENLVLEEIRSVLEERFPQLEVIIAESSVDPAEYIRQVF